MASTVDEIARLPIPPLPEAFTPFHAPPGWVTNFDAFRWHDGTAWWKHRPIIEPRLWVVHTNGASREGSTASQVNWANAGVQSNTHPHYSLNYPQPTKFVPSNRRSIANSSSTSWEMEHGTDDASFWTGSIETRDAGWPNPGHAGGFMDDEEIPDVELVARALAFEAMVSWSMGWLPAPIPAVYPDTYGEPGMVTHTEPWGYPALTIKRGKVCPGDTKKREMREIVLPRTHQITEAWFAQVNQTDPPSPGIVMPPPPSPPTHKEDDMKPTHVINYRGLGYFHPDTLKAVSGSTLATYRQLGVPEIEDDHAETFLSIIETNGAAFACRLGFRAHKNGVELPGLEDELDG